MREKEMDKTIIILFYVIFVGPLSIALFLYGFFPLINYDNTIATENNIPKFVENVRVKIDTLYQPMVTKLIIMVIDALRWDFITGSIGKVAMPVTSSLIANSSGCLFQAKVEQPTVTMPRIKAITTGTIPSFIDIALNFGNESVTCDNVLLQAKRYGYKSIFYGDESWLKLFPSIFDRYDGTESFIVTDFTEVDNNVTRHLHRELHSNNDWSIMILHYLGIDHIGHVYGPFSPLITTKLKEMDNVIAKIHSKVQEWKQNNDSSLFIICGDHGMRNSGGHGGSTMSETTVPFIAIGGECMQNHNQFTEIAQIDIASTLSTILGVPIPFSNLGTIFLDTLYNLPISKQLFILYYNAKQLFNHFQHLNDYKSKYAYQKYLEAIKLHNAWLTTKDHQSDMADDIVLSYKIALKGMKEACTKSIIKYDFYMITVAIFFLCHIICILIVNKFYTSVALKSTIFLIILNTSLWILINYIWENESISLLCTRNLITIAIILFIIIVLTTNCYLLAKISYINFFKIEKTENGVGRWLFPFSAFAHAISLSSSSFVEEEHQIWYFFWVTLLMLLLYNSTTKFCLHLRLNNKQYLYAQSCIQLFLLLIGHRILRKLNSTGDKYAHLPDIAGFLMEQESMLGMTVVLITALTLLVWLDFVHEDKKHKQWSLLFNAVMSVCIYLRHMQNNNVVKIPLYPQSRGKYEAQIFWALLAINFVNYMYRVIFIIKYDKTMFLKIMLSFIIRIWIMTTAVLHRPYNVILLAFQIIFSSIIRIIIKDNNMQETNTFIYTWIGNIFYFYQGNSNSLATVDVNAGYVGIESYMPFVNGLLLIINTYSAPVLAYLLLIYHTVLQYPNDTYEIITETSKTYVKWRLIPLTLYTIIISIHRHHLFIWSVFSPKLFYEAVHFTIICFVTFIILILVIIQKIINNCNR
ncbi:phosphatidylinositol glycan anchor biosynthesis class G isoform X2 [Ptiloglossa arizonensis]|uniref:phosphatidylinositol glycan anchor biosynthesis class G isoform X2 n=1 Tax=Ptiloglossa arizonensis TaxID=3350558 RepID=UPI003FA100AD